MAEINKAIKKSIAICIDELETNCLPGIGDQKCPFKLHGIKYLLYEIRHLFAGEIVILLYKIDTQASLCNTGNPSRYAPSENVKNLCKQLKGYLEKFIGKKSKGESKWQKKSQEKLQEEKTLEKKPTKEKKSVLQRVRKKSSLRKGSK